LDFDATNFRNPSSATRRSLIAESPKEKRLFGSCGKVVPGNPEAIFLRRFSKSS